MDDELLKKYGYVLSSSYRVRVMKALEYDIKTPTNIAKEARITSNHISRVLGELKDADLAECLNEEGIEFSDLYAIASIDLKKDEEALNMLSRYLKIPFVTFSADELNALKGNFSSSDFVKETTGVDNICERAAVLLAGEGGKLYFKKKAGNGVTIAFARREWKIDFYE